MTVFTVGLELAKSVFRVHAVDYNERVVVRKQLRRNKALIFFADLSPCLVGMEACSAKLAAIVEGAEVLRSMIQSIRLIPQDGALATEIGGDLAGLLAIASTNENPAAGGASGACQFEVVAGARNHLFRTHLKWAKKAGQIG